jgi:flagellar hook-associated protein 2
MSTTTFDPQTTAAQLATAYTSGIQAQLRAQTSVASATSAAIDTLRGALNDFTSALSALSLKKSVVANSATFSDPSVGTATAGSTAAPGTYSFFVEQIARAQQVAYGGLADSPAAGNTGNLAVTVGGTSFNVNVGLADKNGDGSLSPAELAAAINTTAANTSLVTASIVTVNGLAQLVLTSNNTGAANTISLDTSGLSAGAVKTALDNAANYRELVAAQDAKVWLGAQGTGTLMQQASNTYTSVAGVTMTFTKAQAAGASPVTLTVGNDSAGTLANVQAFVTAYNKLHDTLDTLTNQGDVSKQVAAAIFANDSGVTSMVSHIAATLRESVNGATLAGYGITAARDGTLSVNSTRLASALAANPTGLDAVFGSSTAGSKSGVLGDLDTYIGKWTNSATGQLAARLTAVTKRQASLTKQQAVLDAQYDSAYKRYLDQFTRLQQLQDAMSRTTSMFDAMFSTSKDN